MKNEKVSETVREKEISGRYINQNAQTSIASIFEKIQPKVEKQTFFRGSRPLHEHEALCQNIFQRFRDNSGQNIFRKVSQYFRVDKSRKKKRCGQYQKAARNVNSM